MYRTRQVAATRLLIVAAAWLILQPALSFGSAEEAARERVGASPSPAETLELPLTIERVWYRTGKKRGFTGSSKSGDLTIGETALVLTTRKGELSIPMESLHTVSYGKMRGDVNTDWIVIAVIDEQGRRLVGLRDGRKFGYGQKTAEIYETLLAAVRQLGAAQYRVPEGFETYDRMAGQYLLALPSGWSIHPRTLTEVGDQAIWGALIFSPHPLAPDPDLPPEQREIALRQALEEVDSGRNGAIFMQRREAQGGMRCKGFSDKAVEKLLGWAGQDRVFAGSRGVEESTRTEEVKVDGCTGLRIVKRMRRQDGTELVLDLRAASDDDTVFLFGLRSREERYEADQVTFDAVMGTVRFSVARRDPL